MSQAIIKDGQKIITSGRVADTVKLPYTLAIGSTEIVVNNPSINDNSLIEVYADKYGIAPTNMVQSGNTLTITFEAQTEVIHIIVSVR